MSMISKLRSVPLTNVPESQLESNNAQRPQAAVPSTGVANTTDGFESANPLDTGIFIFTQQQSSVESQLVQTEAAVDASTLFDYVADVQEPQPPSPPEPPENQNVAVKESQDDIAAVQERLNQLNSKMELYKAEAQDAEARLVKGYSSIKSMLDEMRK